MKVRSKLSEADSDIAVFDESEVDYLPLLPLGNAPSNHVLLPQHNTDSILDTLPTFLREDTEIALQRRISDATAVYQSQRKFDIKNESRPRFNTFDDNFAVEIRRLRDRIDTRLHEAVAAQDLETIEHLISDGVSPAALNLVGLTPLHLCIIHKLIEPFEVLLRHKGSANVKDASGLSVLHVAVLYRWLPGVETVLAAGADVTALCDASRPLLSQTRQRYKQIMYEDFVAAFIQTPIQLATKGDDITILEKLIYVAEQRGAVNCRNKRGQTPLYTAIMNGNLEAVEVLLKKGASMDNISKSKDSALHMAVRKPTILKYLLNVNTNGLSYFSDHGYAPLHQAALCNEPESVKLLLNKFHNIELKTNKQGGMTALHLAAKYFSNETAEVLLEMGANPNEVDDLGNTPLHVAAQTINKDVAALLLRKGAVLSAKDQEGNTALKIIASKFHDALGFFEPVFDEFISAMGIHTLGTTVVYVNYEVLSRNNESQINTVEEFVKCGLRKVLLHPFIESLLYLKWKQLLPIFYVLIMVYATFLISFNLLVVNIFYCKDNFLNTDDSEISAKQMKNSIELPWFEMYGQWYYFLMALNYTSIMLLTFQELFYIYLKKLRYLYVLESWVKLSGLVLAAVLTLAVHLTEIQAWQRHIACAALLLVWLQAMFLLSRFPGWGYYVLMFGKVAINMFKIFITSICLVVGFAFCFMIQFQSKSPFDGPISAIVKTLIMMSSEFDYEDLFGSQHDKQLKHTRTIVRLLFLVFVLFVAIVLVNFMIAVAVSDTKNLNISGNVSRLEKQVDLLSSLEVLVKSRPFARMFKKKYQGKTYHKKMYNSIKANRTWYVECSASVEMYPQVLPSALYRAIMDITRKKDECTTKHNLKNTSKNKIDALYDAIIGKTPGRCNKRQGKGINSYWLRETILRQNEKIHQLTTELASIKEMLARDSGRQNSRDRSSY